jgi:hypothetical protein
MKKFLLTVGALASISLSSIGQTRMTLHEEFTGENCPPCASTNPAFWALCDAGSNPSKLLHISYMVPIPSAGFYCNRTSAIFTARDAYYSVPFAPYGRFDGHVPDATMSSPGHPGFFTQADIDSEAAVASPFTMTMTSVWDPTFSNITTTINVTCVAAYSGTLYLRTALIETNDFPTAPGTNGETHFANVVQAMYPSPLGTSIAGTWTVGMTNSYTITGACPNFVDKNGAPYMVAWIQNDLDKRIAQAAKSAALPGISLDVAASTTSGLPTFVCGSGTYSELSHTATIKNSGTTTLTSATVYSLADGSGTPAATTPWTGSLAAGATTTVTIGAVPFTITGAGGYHTIIDSVGMPNGIPDVNPANNLSGGTFFVENSTGVPIHYSTSFEDLTDTAYYKTDIANNGYKWNIWQTGTSGVFLGHTGTYAAGFQLRSFSAGTVNSIILPELNIPNPSHTLVSFWVAYSQQTTGNTDKLECIYSTDCGANWTPFWTDPSTSAMVTLPASTTANSYPTSPSQYKQYSAKLTGATAGPMLVAFRATNGGGNFLFVDDVDISFSTVGVTNVIPTSENISIYPNPTKEEATLSFTLTQNTDVHVQIVDGLGRVMMVVANEKMDAGSHSYTLNTSSLASGIYNVLIHTEGGMKTERLTVIK